jgi:hypothetical protein
MRGPRKLVYAAGAVVGVIVIVVAAIYLTKSSPSSSTPPAASSTTPGTTTATTATTYTMTTPAKVLKMTRSAFDSSEAMGTNTLAKALASNTTQFKANGWGTPTEEEFSVYMLPGSSTILFNSAFSGFEVEAFNGTFSPSKIVSYYMGKATDPTIESPGPHGGDMMCGLTKQGGSECVWATSSTVGMVMYVKAGYSAHYANMYLTTLKFRKGIEVPAK